MYWLHTVKEKMKTYKIQNQYSADRDRAIETGQKVVKALGIDLEIPDQSGIYGGDTWDAVIGLSRSSLTVVIKVYSGDRPDLDLPFLTVFESNDRRMSPQY